MSRVEACERDVERAIMNLATARSMLAAARRERDAARLEAETEGAIVYPWPMRGPDDRATP